MRPVSTVTWVIPPYHCCYVVYGVKCVDLASLDVFPGDCAFGFDATEDKKHCNPRSDTIVVLGGRPQGNGAHNFNDGYVLLPNAEKWARFLPNTAGGAFTYVGIYILQCVC